MYKLFLRRKGFIVLDKSTCTLYDFAFKKLFCTLYIMCMFFCLLQSILQLTNKPPQSRPNLIKYLMTPHLCVALFLGNFLHDCSLQGLGELGHEVE
jgi:hypothetical protein